MKTLLSILILTSFLISLVIGPLPVAEAQEFRLPVPGVIVRLSPTFVPPILKGIKVHLDNPFRFDFILKKGEEVLNERQLKEESSKLIKYFLATLTVPENDLWVNLSPYERNRIIPQAFGQTGMGRDLLAEDYILKQITASLIYPEDKIGKRFWCRVYEEAVKKFGTTNIPVSTFNKVWIVPEKAVVYENVKAGTAYVVEAKLKVMLEQDYLSLQKHTYSKVNNNQGESVNALGSQIVREIVIPELTKEVNEGKNFTQLRQVYNSLILATWYKKKIKDSILQAVYSDKNKVGGINIDDLHETQKIYKRYLQAFKKGAFDFIKQETDILSHQPIPRKYFSGGASLRLGKAFEETENMAMINPAEQSTEFVENIRLDAAMSPSRKQDNTSFLKQIVQWVLRQKIEDLQENEISPSDPRLRSLFEADQRLSFNDELKIGEEIKQHKVLRVLQFNQMGNPEKDRLQKMTHEITKLSQDVPSVITLQETSQRIGQYNTAVEVANELDYAHQEYLYRDHGNFQEGMAILYPRTFEQVGMYHQLIPEKIRVQNVLLLGVKLRSKITGKEVYVFTTRLSWDRGVEGYNERQRQLEIMNQYIRQVVSPHAPVIFAGDFNYSDERENQALSENLRGFDDSFRKLNPNLRGTTTSKAFRISKFEGKRPDLIYSSPNLIPVSSRVVLNQDPVSDHLGIMSDFKWSDEPLRELKGLSVKSDDDLVLSILPSLSREDQVGAILRIIDPVNFQKLNLKTKNRVLNFSKTVNFSEAEYDQYEQNLIDNLNFSDSLLIKQILKENSKRYIENLEQTPKETLVIIQAAGNNSRLNVELGKWVDKNTEKIGGLSQLQRHLNVLAVLGYQHVLIVHSDKNKDRVEENIQSGRYPSSMQINLMNGSNKGWLENYIDAVKSAKGQFKKAMMLIGESPVSIEYLAQLRYSDTNNAFLFYPVQNSLHRIQSTPQGIMKDYEAVAGAGTQALASFVAPVDTLLDHWVNAADNQLIKGHSIETYINSVKSDVNTKAFFVPEALGNINIPEDLFKMRRELFFNAQALGKFRGGEQAIFPRRLARAVLIKNGYFYGYKNLNPVDFTTQFSEHSTVWSTQDGVFFIKAHLNNSTLYVYPGMFHNRHYLQEKWFYTIPLKVLKPKVVAFEDGLSVIVSKNVNPKKESSLMDKIKTVLSQKKVQNAVESLADDLKGSMVLLADIQKSRISVRQYPVEENLSNIIYQSERLSELGYDMLSWKKGIEFFRNYYEQHKPELVLSHGDFGPGNILASHPLALVDGEYAGESAPRENDLATFLVRLYQSFNYSNNNTKFIINELLSSYEKFSGHSIDPHLLYFFMAKKLLESAYDISYFRQDDLSNRKYLEAARQLIMLMQEDQLEVKNIDQINQQILSVFSNSKMYTDILDHLRQGRFDSESSFRDSNRLSNIKAYFEAGKGDSVISLLRGFLEDREFQVRDNAKRAIEIFNPAMNSLREKRLKSTIEGGIDLTAPKVNLQIQNKEGAIRFRINAAQIRRFQSLSGFIPVIISILPMKNLSLFLDTVDSLNAS